jgi:hypothetical protein
VGALVLLLLLVLQCGSNWVMRCAVGTSARTVKLHAASYMHGEVDCTCFSDMYSFACNERPWCVILDMRYGASVGMVRNAFA